MKHKLSLTCIHRVMTGYALEACDRLELDWRSIGA